MSVIAPNQRSAECHSARSPNSIRPGVRGLLPVAPSNWGPATGPKARPIPAWGNAPGIESHTQQGLKARPIFPHHIPISSKPTRWDSPRRWRSGIGGGAFPGALPQAGMKARRWRYPRFAESSHLQLWTRIPESEPFRSAEHCSAWTNARRCEPSNARRSGAYQRQEQQPFYFPDFFASIPLPPFLCQPPPPHQCHTVMPFSCLACLS